MPITVANVTVLKLPDGTKAYLHAAVAVRDFRWLINEIKKKKGLDTVFWYGHGEACDGSGSPIQPLGLRATIMAP
jgi:hypothetical protein